ncbi:MAG TPA: SRPBCC family protein [Streptosporangiales bacterium]
MRLDQKVTVPAHVDDVWKLLDDIPTVAACMPGAELTRTIDDSTYEGTVKVAIGPLSMNYTGTVSIEERSEPDRRIVLLASGRDRRGSGTAKAHVTVRLVPGGESTDLEVGTDLQLTGRIAALGRGVHDVANRLFVEFADRLAAQLDTSPTASPATEPEPPQQVTAKAAPPDTSELKILPLLLSVTRERLAAFLLRLSQRVKP